VAPWFLRFCKQTPRLQRSPRDGYRNLRANAENGEKPKKKGPQSVRALKFAAVFAGHDFLLPVSSFRVSLCCRTL
jgi:hypothetical protein